MKRLRQLILASFVALLGLTVAAPLAPSVGAIDVFGGACNHTGGATTGGGVGGAAAAGASGGTSSGGICGASTKDNVPDIIKTVINLLLFVLGMIAVVMIVIGGIRYTTSNGEASSIKSAKDTIMYAVVGLVVAVLSFAIVNFVLGWFK